ncbi:MAG: glycosyltransferase family 39 protein [Patescibacteria group bacterium]
MKTNLSFIRRSWITFFNRNVKVLVILILAVMLVLEITSAYQESQVIDESPHIMAGYSYLNEFNIEMNKEHPPLLKMMSALPLQFMNINYPWSDSTNLDQWDDSRTFLYTIGNPADQMLFWGRLPLMLLSLLLGFFVFYWASKLTNNFGGLLALILYAFDPNILTHSRYITTDMGVTCFMFISCFYFYKFFITQSIKDLLLLSSAITLALLSKFSAAFLAPVMLVFLFFKKIKFKNYLLLIIVPLAFISVGISLVYFFEPMKYYEGFKMLYEHNIGGHSTYLMGELSKVGWWYYFPIAFFVKTPAITLILLIISLLIFGLNFLKIFKNKQIKENFKNNKEYIRNGLYLLVLPVSYFIYMISGNINLGVRHLMPMYPFLFVFIAFVLMKYIEKIKQSNKKNIVNNFLVILAVIIIVNTMIVFPNFLSHFSWFIGGTNNGGYFLLDSNLDWGQGVKKLAKYLEENNINETIKLDYFGQSVPAYYNINYEPYHGETRTGFIVVSKQLIYGDEDNVYGWLKEIKPTAEIGKSMFVYDLR